MQFLRLLPKLLVAVILLCCIFIRPVHAQQVLDSAMYKPGFWHSKAVRISTVPLILFAGSAAVWGERQNVRELRNRYIPTFRHHFDDYMQYVPALAVFGLNAAGVKGKTRSAGPSCLMPPRHSSWARSLTASSIRQRWSGPMVPSAIPSPPGIPPILS